MYICNLECDYISKILLSEFNEEKRIELDKSYNKVLGSENIISFENKIFITNGYANTLSMVNLLNDSFIEEYYIGAHCNDVAIVNNKAYITCNESNNIILFDLLSRRIVESIPCGSSPCNISYNVNNKLIIVSNFGEDSITIINPSNHSDYKTIRVGNCPTKAGFSEDGRCILVCESNMEDNKSGNINIIDICTMKSVNNIGVGVTPLDFIDSGEYYYIANFSSKNISIINKKSLNIVETIETYELPKKILKDGIYLYTLSGINDIITRINLLNREKRSLSLGGTPSAMLVN